ncbi:MAG: trans-aconitate 2-methyltransferase [Prochlorococcus sp.]
MTENGARAGLSVMQRLPEPELMNDPLQAKAYADADFSCEDEGFICRLQEYLVGLGKIPAPGNLIIDLGCGPGNISERLQGLWPLSDVLGIDGSQAMLDLARQRQRKSAVDLQGLSYRCANLCSLVSGAADLSSSAVVVVSNSLLHHLHKPHLLWDAIKHLAAPGAVVFHRDLRRPLSSEQVIELKNKYMHNSPSILIRDYLASLHAAFTLKEVQFQLHHAGLDQLKVIEVEDRYLEVFGTM